MRKPMLNAIQKVKMAMAKKKPKLSTRKPKFNAKLKAAAAEGKLDSNPNFKAAVMKGKKPKMAMAKKKAKMAMAKKKPKLMGPGLGQKKGKRKNPKMAMRKKK
tara:strand:- start:755 stop:1063 length:309 start_codon:yes stop_codon:yes gene_type:complete